MGFEGVRENFQVVLDNSQFGIGLCSSLLLRYELLYRGFNHSLFSSVKHEASIRFGEGERCCCLQRTRKAEYQARVFRFSMDNSSSLAGVQTSRLIIIRFHLLVIHSY
jgi:hypothetical protein